MMRQPPGGLHHCWRCGRSLEKSSTVSAASSLFSMSQCRRWVEAPTIPFVEQIIGNPARGVGGRSKIHRGGLHDQRPGQGLTVSTPAPVVEYISHAPAVSLSPAPVVEYVSPAPAVSHTIAPVVEYISPATAVTRSPQPAVEKFSRARAVFPSPAPVVEHFSPASAVSQSPELVVEYLSPVPAVSQSPEAVEEYFSLAVSMLPNPVVDYFALAPTVFPSTELRRERGTGEGHQDFLRDQGSTAFSGADNGHGTLQGIRRGGGQLVVEKRKRRDQQPRCGSGSGRRVGRGSGSRRFLRHRMFASTLASFFRRTSSRPAWARGRPRHRG